MKDRLLKAQGREVEAANRLSTLLDADTIDAVAMEAAKKELGEARSALAGAIELEKDRPLLESRADSPEGAELRHNLESANVGKIFQHAMGLGPVDGVEAELQKHFGIPSNSIPLAMLEKRAAATTSGDEPNTDNPVIPIIFPLAAAPFCGVTIETVGAGESLYPVLSTGATVHTPAASAAAGESTGDFDVTTLTPKRLQASFAYQREKAAMFAMMPNALRQNLSESIQDKLDERILNRTGDGLLDFGTDPANPSAESTYSEYSSAMFAAVDGTYANMIGDVRMLLGSSIYAHMAETYRGNNAAESILEILNRQSGGIRVSGNVAAYANNRQEAVVIKGGPRRNCVAALWDGVALFEDQVSRAEEGEIQLYAVGLYDFAVTRETGYVRHRFRNS